MLNIRFDKKISYVGRCIFRRNIVRYRQDLCNVKQGRTLEDIKKGTA